MMTQGFCSSKVAGSWCFGDGCIFFPHLADIVLRDAHVAAQGRQCIDEIQRLVREDVTGAGVFDDVGNLAIAELEIDGDGNGTQRGNSHIGIDEVCAIARENTDAIADADAAA